MLPWTLFTCYTKDNQQGCFRQLILLAAFGAVDEPLASCMIVHFSAHISKWELVCKFGVIFHIFIISCLCSRFHVRNQWFFYSVITFSYIKCFVHSYTVDVVFTLSYHRWLFMIFDMISLQVIMVIVENMEGFKAALCCCIHYWHCCMWSWQTSLEPSFRCPFLNHIIVLHLKIG